MTKTQTDIFLLPRYSQQRNLVFFDQYLALFVQLPERFLVVRLAHTESAVDIVRRTFVGELRNAFILTQVFDDGIAELVVLSMRG